jgi:plastocyanin
VVASLRSENLAVWAITLTGLLSSVTALATGASDQTPASHTVVIENMQFNPPTLAVRRGERIVWANKDLFPHTATAAAKAFDSGSIAVDGSWSFTPHKAGSYPYGCTFHPTMKGTITVQ